MSHIAPLHRLTTTLTVPGREEAVKILIDGGADVEAVSFEGETPLTRAITGGECDGV